MLVAPTLNNKQLYLQQAKNVKQPSMSISKLIIFLISLALLASCSSKTTEQVVKTKPKVTEPTKVTPENPCVTFDQLPGGKRDEVETAYVLYKDFLKEEKWDQAFAYWKVAYYGAPASNGSVKYQFDDGVKIYTHFYQAAATEAEKKTMVDSVMSIYDKRIECFGEAAYTQGRKGFDYYYTFPGTVSDAEILELFKKNIDAKGKEADYFIINPMTKLLNDGVIDGTVSHDDGKKYAVKIFDAIEYGQKTCKGQYCDAWQTIANYAPVRLESLEGIDGFYDCKYYSDKYYTLYEADPTNCDIIQQVYRKLLRGGCDINGAKATELKGKIDTDCYTPPPAPGSLRQGFDAYNSGKYKEAVGHFEDYVNASTEADKKFKYLMLIAKIYYRDIKNFPQSKKYALMAADIDQSSGEPYMLIGKLYASSGPLCGPGTGFDSQVVTWVAIDQFIKAKMKDPSVEAEANNLISQYAQYMPSKEDIFQRRLSAGDTYKVPCWIQENTRVRTAD